LAVLFTAAIALFALLTMALGFSTLVQISLADRDGLPGARDAQHVAEEDWVGDAASDIGEIAWICGCTVSVTGGSEVVSRCENPMEDLRFPDRISSIYETERKASSSLVQSEPPTIPKVTHFISRLLSEEDHEEEWCNDVPCGYVEYMHKYVEMNRDFEFQLHCSSDLEHLIQRISPELWTFYSGFSEGIQRADFARYFILYHYGGLYSDMDVEPRLNMTDLLDGNPSADLFLGVETMLDSSQWQENMLDLRNRCMDVDAEPEVADFCNKCADAIESESASELVGCVQPIRGGEPEASTRIANFWMMSSPGHKFWGDVLNLLKERSQLPLHTSYDVLYTTGPDLVSEVFAQYSENDGLQNIKVLSEAELRSTVEHHTSLLHSWRKRFSDTACEIAGIC